MKLHDSVLVRYQGQKVKKPMQARLQEDFGPLAPPKTWVSSHFSKKNERITNVFEDCGSAKHVAIWYQRGQKNFWYQYHKKQYWDVAQAELRWGSESLRKDKRKTSHKKRKSKRILLLRLAFSVVSSGYSQSKQGTYLIRVKADIRNPLRYLLITE